MQFSTLPPHGELVPHIRKILDPSLNFMHFYGNVIKMSVWSVTQTYHLIEKWNNGIYTFRKASMSRGTAGKDWIVYQYCGTSTEVLLWIWRSRESPEDTRNHRDHIHPKSIQDRCCYSIVCHWPIPKWTVERRLKEIFYNTFIFLTM